MLAFASWERVYSYSPGYPQAYKVAKVSVEPWIPYFQFSIAWVIGRGAPLIFTGWAERDSSTRQCVCSEILMKFEKSYAVFEARVSVQAGRWCMLVCWKQQREERVQHQRGGRQMAKRKSERWMRKHGSFRSLTFPLSKREGLMLYLIYVEQSSVCHVGGKGWSMETCQSSG